MLYFPNDYTKELLASIESAKSTLTICSAYIKSPALVEILKGIDQSVSVRVVARWQKHDLAFGASDLDVYDVCRSNGWDFGIDLNLHGKVYVVDENEIYLGSANLTHRGMNLGNKGNNEFGTKIISTSVDMDKFNQYIKTEVTWCDDRLFEKIREEMATVDNSDNSKQIDWSKDVLNKIAKSPDLMWVSDLLRCGPDKFFEMDIEDEDVIHDLELLNLESQELAKEDLVRGLERTRCYRWLISILAKHGSARFGLITAELHDAIIDDPKPYRKDVKDYVSTLYSWMEFLTDDFVVERPRHTQVARLRGQE